MNTLYDMIMMGYDPRQSGMGDWGASSAMAPWQPMSWGQPYQARNDIGVMGPRQPRNDIGVMGGGGGWANRPVSSGGGNRNQPYRGNSAYGYASQQPLSGSVSNPSTDADRAFFQKRLAAFRAANPGGGGLTRVARNDPRARPVFGGPLPSGPRQARNDIGYGPRQVNANWGAAQRPMQARNDIGYGPRQVNANWGAAQRPMQARNDIGYAQRPRQNPMGVISPNTPPGMRPGGAGGGSMGSMGSLGGGRVVRDDPRARGTDIGFRSPRPRYRGAGG